MRDSPDVLKKKYGFENPFKADPLSRKSFKYLPAGGQLLDIGCGEGADSVFFGKKGFHVTAIDKNKEYLNRFRRFCKDHNLRFALLNKFFNVRFSMINNEQLDN